jgi:hypothetical protein
MRKQLFFTVPPLLQTLENGRHAPDARLFHSRSDHSTGFSRKDSITALRAETRKGKRSEDFTAMFITTPESGLKKTAQLSRKYLNFSVASG